MASGLVVSASDRTEPRKASLDATSQRLKLCRKPQKARLSSHRSLAFGVTRLIHVKSLRVSEA
jgi:hypothetical protein